MKFEKVKRLKDEEVRLPERATKHSAGYDFFGVDKVEIQPGKMEIVRTGIKAKIDEGKFLMLANRSSNPSKLGLVLGNGIGVVDADYYSNDSNDGEIGFMFMNITDEVVVLKPGDKLGQGIIVDYHTVSDDSSEGTRKGGFGSTGR